MIIDGKVYRYKLLHLDPGARFGVKGRDRLTRARWRRKQFAAEVSDMRALLLLLVAALLTACATQPNVGVGGQAYGRAAQGGVRVGVPF
jgi:hypothetical protein